MRTRAKPAKRPRRSRIVIRPCTIPDIDEVLDLWKHAAAEPSVTDDRGALRRRLKRDRQLFLLAFDDTRLIATLIGGWDGWRASMARLAVAPEYRRSGVAKRLVEAVERRLLALGARRVNALVLRDNATGAAFWRAAGYRPDHRIRRFLKDL